VILCRSFPELPARTSRRLIKVDSPGDISSSILVISGADRNVQVDNEILRIRKRRRGSIARHGSCDGSHRLSGLPVVVDFDDRADDRPQRVLALQSLRRSLERRSTGSRREPRPAVAMNH
jgi:hypothetical protein